MDKREYFLAALKAGTYLYKDWVLSVFSVTQPDPNAVGDKYPFKLIAPSDPKAKTGGFWQFAMYNDGSDSYDANGVIDGSKADEAIFNFRDELILKAGDLPNLKKNIKTTYGNALWNMMVLCWPFGDKVEYQEGQISGKKIDAMIAARLKDTPADDKDRNKDDLYVDEFLNYMEAVSAIGGFAQLCVPAASPKTMTVDPSVLKLRDKLFEENKDQLNDLAVVAKIEQQLVDADWATLKGDDAEEFFLTGAKTGGKSMALGRKRMHIDFGAEVGFTAASKPRTIKKPLRDGLDLNEMPILIDTLRSGSYNRGAETALGGESVKYFYRVFQNTQVVEPDCGVKVGLPWEIRQDNYKQFLNLYAVTNGAPLLLTEESIQKFIGRKIYIRSPMLCKTPAPSFCASCVGKALAAMPTALHIAASNVGSRFMGAAMKKMHGQVLAVKRYDFKQAIT